MTTLCPFFPFFSLCACEDSSLLVGSAAAPPWQHPCSAARPHPSLVPPCLCPAHEHTTFGHHSRAQKHARTCTPATLGTQIHRRPCKPRLRAPPSPYECSGGLSIPRRAPLTQTLVKMTPGALELVSSGEVRRGTAAGIVSRRVAPPPRAQTCPSRPIRSQRIRLDPNPNRAEPLDQDPTAHTRRYRFGLDFLLKSPRFSTKSTRTPWQCKSFCRSAQIFTQTPPSFLEMEPAVQSQQFAC